MIIYPFLTILISSLFVVLLNGGASYAQIVITDKGPVRGMETDKAYIWKGIPYAEPPLGPLRWKPPQVSSYRANE